MKIQRPLLQAQQPGLSSSKTPAPLFAARRRSHIDNVQRLTVLFAPDELTPLQTLASRLHRSVADIIREGLLLLEWALEQVALGRQVGSMDIHGGFHQAPSSPLQQLRSLLHRESEQATPLHFGKSVDRFGGMASTMLPEAISRKSFTTLLRFGTTLTEEARLQAAIQEAEASTNTALEARLYAIANLHSQLANVLEKAGKLTEAEGHRQEAQCLRDLARSPI